MRVTASVSSVRDVPVFRRANPAPFGPNGAEFARLNMGTSRALLTEAVTRMAAALV